MLEIRNNLLENFTGAHKHMIDLAASTIPSSYLLPELLAAFGKTLPDVYFTPYSQTVLNPSAGCWTEL